MHCPKDERNKVYIFCVCIYVYVCILYIINFIYINFIPPTLETIQKRINVKEVAVNSHPHINYITYSVANLTNNWNCLLFFTSKLKQKNVPFFHSFLSQSLLLVIALCIICVKYFLES